MCGETWKKFYQNRNYLNSIIFGCTYAFPIYESYCILPESLSMSLYIIWRIVVTLVAHATSQERAVLLANANAASTRNVFCYMAPLPCHVWQTVWVYRKGQRVLDSCGRWAALQVGLFLLFNIIFLYKSFYITSFYTSHFIYMRSHPIRLEDHPEDFIPLKLHGDGTPVTGLGKQWSQMVDIFSVSSILVYAPTILRLALCLC